MKRLSFSLCALLALAACGGGDSDTTMNSTTVSEGQELIDLQRARDTGAISDEEYEDQKEKILDRD